MPRGGRRAAARPWWSARPTRHGFYGGVVAFWRHRKDDVAPRRPFARKGGRGGLCTAQQGFCRGVVAVRVNRARAQQHPHPCAVAARAADLLDLAVEHVHVLFVGVLRVELGKIAAGIERSGKHRLYGGSFKQKETSFRWGFCKKAFAFCGGCLCLAAFWAAFAGKGNG